MKIIINDIFRKEPYKNNLFGILIDIEKMFDSINWNILFEHFIGIPMYLIDMLKQIYDISQINKWEVEIQIRFKNGIKGVLMDLCYDFLLNYNKLYIIKT